MWLHVYPHTGYTDNTDIYIDYESCECYGFSNDILLLQHIDYSDTFECKRHEPPVSLNAAGDVGRSWDDQRR